MPEWPGTERLWAALPQARVVGGAVRDTLAHRPFADIDFAAPLPPAEVMARLAAASIKAVATGLSHGTVTAIIDGRGFEITSLRRDEQTDGRHAVIAFTDSWEEDASRRDFTINAMSASRDGTIFDYYGGRADLAAGRVKFVGDAATRIKEDYLRILRFFRFHARYGQGAPDPGAVTAITMLRHGIGQLAAERIWNEIKSLLRAGDPCPAVDLMQQTGVLDLILPQADPRRLQSLINTDAPARPLLRLAALSHEAAAALALRLKLSGDEQQYLAALQQPNQLRPTSGDAELRRALAGESAEILAGRTWLAQDTVTGWAALRGRMMAMPRPVFPLHGRDITASGIPPGPEVGRILAKIHAWWLAGGCLADAQTCRAQIGKL